KVARRPRNWQALFDRLPVAVLSHTVVRVDGSGRVSVISRTPTSNVKYDQIQPSMTESRLRTPTRKRMCTAPQSHHAAAPVTFTRPKSATALLRPIVARLPWCRYRNGGGGCRALTP